MPSQVISRSDNLIVLLIAVSAKRFPFSKRGSGLVVPVSACILHRELDEHAVRVFGADKAGRKS